MILSKLLEWRIDLFDTWHHEISLLLMLGYIPRRRKPWCSWTARWSEIEMYDSDIWFSDLTGKGRKWGHWLNAVRTSCLIHAVFYTSLDILKFGCFVDKPSLVVCLVALHAPHCHQIAVESSAKKLFANLGVNFGKVIMKCHEPLGESHAFHFTMPFYICQYVKKMLCGVATKGSAKPSRCRSPQKSLPHRFPAEAWF